LDLISINEKTTSAARIIPTLLSTNIESAPEMTDKFKVATPIPIVASGGTRAMAIAVPGKVSLSSGFIRANAVVSPATIAINKYTTLGSVRDKISGLNTSEKFPELTENCHRKRVVSAESTIAYKPDFIRVLIERWIVLLSEILIPNAVANIGESIGAISIEPIITEALLMRRPQVAIITDRITIKKNAGLGVDSLISEFIAIFLSASLMSLNSRYIISLG